MTKHTVDQTQPGGQVHRLEPGCGEAEPRVITGQLVTPEHLRKIAAAHAAGDALEVGRLLLDVLVGRAAVDGLLGEVQP